MAADKNRWRGPGPWIVIAGLIVVLVFLLFYQPLETYLVASIPHIHFHNVLFWFASLVAVFGYAIAHWQSFAKHMFPSERRLDVQALVFETLQIGILIAVIFCAGAMLQAIEMLGEHLMNRGPIIDGVFGEKLLAIVLLLILAVLFYLLHHVVKASRTGWHVRRPPRAPRAPGASPDART